MTLNKMALKWARSNYARRLSGYFYGCKKTFRDARLGNAIVGHGGFGRALLEWLLTEVTGQPNREWRPWPLCGLLNWPRRRGTGTMTPADVRIRLYMAGKGGAI